MGLGKTVEILALIMAHRWPRSKSNLMEHEISPVSKPPPSREQSTSDSIAVDNKTVSGPEIVSPPTTNLATEKKESICEDPISNKTEVEVIINKDVVTPSGEGSVSDRGDKEEQPDVIQCLCGATREDEKQFVQCEHCLVWQHSSCADYSAEKHGEHFYCVKCLLDKVATTYCNDVFVGRASFRRG